MTNRAATFVGNFLISYCWEYFESVIVVCEYCGGVVDVLLNCSSGL